MTRSSTPSRDVVADGISIRVRVRRATSTSKLEYGEPQDMVCTIVHWDASSSSSSSSARTTPTKTNRGGSTFFNKQQRQQNAGRAGRRTQQSSNIATAAAATATSTFARQFRSNSSSKTDPVPYYGGKQQQQQQQFAPTLFFQARTHPGHTLEACCSLQSVSSYDDSLDPSIISDTTNNTSSNNNNNSINNISCLDATIDNSIINDNNDNYNIATAQDTDATTHPTAMPLDLIKEEESAATPPHRNVDTSHNHNTNSSHVPMRYKRSFNYPNHSQNNNTKNSTINQHYNGNNNKRKNNNKTYAVPCSGIKTVENVSSLFRGYRIFFATGSRGSYELEFENKNGMDIMMAFLQATLPAERFVNLSGSSGATPSIEGNNSDTASYLSTTLDVEKLTERLAERHSNRETVSEKLRKGVGQMVSSMEEMSNSFCGNMCCTGNFMMSSSVAPYEPPDEVRDCPPTKGSGTDNNNSTDNTKISATLRFEMSGDDVLDSNLHGGVGPLMEIDEEKSVQSSAISTAADSYAKVTTGTGNNAKNYTATSTTTTKSTASSKDNVVDDDDTLMDDKRSYLRDYKLPSGLSMELPDIE